MKFYSSFSFLLNRFSNKNFYLQLFLYSFLIFFISCSSVKRIYDDTASDNYDSFYVRVLVNERPGNLSLIVKDKLYLSNESEIIAEVKSGNNLNFSSVNENIKLQIADKTFTAGVFWIESAADNKIIVIDEKKYRGKLRVFNLNNEIKIVNELRLEDYVKGVMTREMPVGKGNDNYNALKAFSICIRTYAFNRIAQKRDSFDLYPDTRDQVYGGVVSETDFTNQIVDETAGQILSFDGKPAQVFYHSTCGGFTEDVQNVFNSEQVPYLISIKDGLDPFCKVSPRYEWTEKYSESLFINRLFNSGLLKNSDYSIQDISVDSRFESGRVNELKINLINTDGQIKNISLFSNNIRSIIKTSDGSSILRSTMFNITLDSNKNVLINGKGFGHGVGMCQWGAIGQSKQGISYKDILNHYYPGTEIILIDDKF
ncbi:MAG: SpoIID/LytB domain-containing protein [Ignavibacterium sp.]|nr:SpoIID/LytB domain-containing protein [Ignavibacterium sp.]